MLDCDPSGNFVWVQVLKRSQTENWNNLNAAILGFDTTSDVILENIMNPWIECCQEFDCIQPPGANRKNHRQDQSILTILACSSGLYHVQCDVRLLKPSIQLVGI